METAHTSRRREIIEIISTCGSLYLPRSAVRYLKSSTNILHVPLAQGRGGGEFANQISNTIAAVTVDTIPVLKASSKTRGARHSLEISGVFFKCLAAYINQMFLLCSVQNCVYAYGY